MPAKVRIHAARARAGGKRKDLAEELFASRQATASEPRTLCPSCTHLGRVIGSHELWNLSRSDPRYFWAQVVKKWVGPLSPNG